jgi:hypothetical protein
VLDLGDGYSPRCSCLVLAVPHGVLYPHANRDLKFGKKMFDVRDIILISAWRKGEARHVPRERSNTQYDYRMRGRDAKFHIKFHIVLHYLR